jgi:signal transduction histidine kinase/response regulator RpfG family c-di-GMP phosphodiesterase
VTDAKTGEMTLTNELVRNLLGLEREQAYERMHTSSGTMYEEDEFPPIRVVRTGESVFAEDMTVLGDSGMRTDLIVNAAPIFDADGNLVSAVAVFQDVSELRELENVLQESLRETTSLYEISRAIAAENELTSILGVVAAQIVGVISYSHMFAIFRDESGLPSQTYVARLKDSWRVTELDECPLPMVVLPLNENLVENDIAHNPDLAGDPQLRELGIGSVAVFPLNARGHQVGWLATCTSHQHTFTSEERRFLTTLSDRAAVAVENARLAQQTTDALSETKLLYEASFAINRAVSIENTLEIMREQVKAFAPSQIDVFLVMPRQETSEIDWVMHWVVGDPATHDEIRLIDAPIIDDAQIIESDPYFIENVAMSSLQDIRLLRRLAQWEAVVAQASVPLNVAGRSTGRLIVSFNRPYKFGRVERQFLTTIADQAAIVINNSMLVQQTQDSLEETGTLYQSSRAISDAPDLQGVLNAIIDHAVPPQVNWAMIVRLLSSDWDVPGALVEVAANWERVETYDMTGLRFDTNSFPAWEQASQPEMLWVNDLTTEAGGSTVSAASLAFYENLGLQAVVAVPLTASGQTIGALMLGANEPWIRTERETRIYTSLADQVAISIENRSLLDQTQRRARQLQTSAQVAQAASSILDLEELLNRTVNLIKDSFLYDHVQIFLVSIDNRDAQLVASTGEAGKQLLSIHHSLPVGSMSVIGLTTATGVPQLAADTADARVVHRANPYLPNTRSELALPLIAKGRVLGALDVQSNRPNAFSQEDQSVLANLSDQVAIAIDNARLFELSTNRVEEMRFLFDVTRTATSVGEMEEAVKQVSDLILGHLKAATTSIFVLDDTNTQFVRYTSDLSASLGNTPTSFEIENPIFKEVLATKQPEIVHETTAHPYWQRFPEVRSGVLMPLLSGDDLVGILAISMRERNAFTADTTQLLQTMTTTLAAIIQSARLLQQVQAANVRLREVDKLKSQFLANMSHELRTPLNSIIGFSRVILKGIDGPLTTMQEQDLGTIHESGKHLLNLVNDILDQAKIEAGKMELSYSFFSVVDLLKSVMSTAVGLVKDKPVRLHQEIENDLPQAWGDEFRSRQVLLNLVSNAAKFTAQGSVTVSAFLIEDEGKRTVQVSVTDTGIGIPQDKLESVFEAFQQVENTTARQYEGTGLGLPIAKSLIQMQGGRIWVDSEPGVGSTFSFTLPIEQPEVPEAEQAEPEGEGASEVPVEVNAELENQVVEAIEQAETPKTTQRIILAIDDELSMVNLYRRYLIRSGYEVIGGSPEEAEELAITYQPRVILLDVNMPNRSGWDVLAKLKDRDETFEIPVIVCTVEADRERAFRLGAAEFLMKSIDEQTLIQTVRRVELERDRRKVLIIDDQPESIRLIRDALIADERFSVIDALGGEQGIDMVNNHWPDLIILDLRMPGVDGFSVYETLRAYPDTASIPLIIVTADDITDEERQRLNGVLIYQKQTIDSADLLNNVVSQLTW